MTHANSIYISFYMPSPIMFLLVHIISLHDVSSVFPLFFLSSFQHLTLPGHAVNYIENFTSHSRKHFNQHRETVLDTYAVTSMSLETHGRVLCVHPQSLLRLSRIIKKQRIENGSHVSEPLSESNTIKVDFDGDDTAYRDTCCRQDC